MAEGEEETTSNSERAEHAESIGRDEDRVTAAAQEAVENVTETVETAVSAAEEHAETVAEAVLDAATDAAEKADVPELAGAVAQIVIDRLREANLTIAQVTEEATDAAQDVAEAAEEAIESSVEIVGDTADSISPSPDHWWFKWPPTGPRRSRR